MELGWTPPNDISGARSLYTSTATQAWTRRIKQTSVSSVAGQTSFRVYNARNKVETGVANKGKAEVATKAQAGVGVTTYRGSSATPSFIINQGEDVYGDNGQRS
jgi:hypothetical protein